MRNRNYTKEIGMPTEKVSVPKPVSATVLLTVVVCTVLFAREVSTLNHTAADKDQARAEAKVSSR
jgi:hypothetical protein